MEGEGRDRTGRIFLGLGEGRFPIPRRKKTAPPPVFPRREYLRGGGQKGGEMTS